MTNSWTDIKNADVVMIIGSNAAENHPMAMQHVQKAKDNGATLINVDPRFCRSSSKADIHAYMRSGTDIAFIGGMIKYALDNNLYNDYYVKECTNALLKLNTGFQTCEEGTIGIFSDYSAGTYNATLDATLDAKYGTKDANLNYSRPTWAYDVPLAPTGYIGGNLNDTDCVFNKLRTQFQNYTIENVCAITGTDPVVYEQICQTYCGTYPNDKSATIMYAMGTTQHTVGTQNIRAYSILQLLLGNIGVAGGGINALRGQDNVQGATDQCVLQHILPGYLKVPTPAQTSLSLYNAAYYNSAQTVSPLNMQTSQHWWKNGTKYIASLLKAWWPSQPVTTSFNYLSKKTADYTILSMFDAMYNGQIDGAIFDGENPAVSDPASDHVRDALAQLAWLVCIDPFETETAAFWRKNTSATTTVYLLPAAVALEKYGSRSNSSRWLQWHWSGANPPGWVTGFGSSDYGAKTDMDILVELGTRLQTALAGTSQLDDLSWPCLNYTTETNDALAELIAKEMHGYNMTGDDGGGGGTTPGTLVTNFVGLNAAGLTACGNWLHSGSFASSPDIFESPNNASIWTVDGYGGGTSINRAKRRYPQDVCHLGPTNDPLYAANQIGLYSYWAWCWPINRRIVYNRASTVQSTGAALAPNKYVMYYQASPPVGGNVWRGDMNDGTANPGATLPFIMNKDGLGHLFGGWTVAEGPFPWHYEPAESPITYPSWLGNYRMNPTVHLYTGASFATHGDSTYNIFATTYRLTEHWHTGSMSRNLPRLNELMPEPFVEMSEELAADTTAIPTGPIASGDLVKITSARGDITVKACVTKRLKPFNLNGTTVHQVGVIWHWGFMALSKGDSGNVLTPFIGDANTRIPESKCFMVNIEKV